MLNISILILVVVVLFSASKRLGRTLTAGSIENVIKRSETALEKINEDAKNPNAKSWFAVAWLLSLTVSTTMIGLSIYILINILSFT